jgi:hypothetical protein
MREGFFGQAIGLGGEGRAPGEGGAHALPDRLLDGFAQEGFVEPFPLTLFL